MKRQSKQLSADSVPSPITLESPAIQEQLRFETMLSDISSRFVHLPADQIDQQIEQCLQLITETLGIDRCSIAQQDPAKRELRITHAYAVAGAPPMPELVLSRQQPWYSKRLVRGESIVVSSVEELPDEAQAEKRYCREQGLKSLALIPLSVSGSFLGVLGFAAMKTERRWPAMLVQRLGLVGGVFANALMRKQSEQQLHQAFAQIQALKERLEAENSYLREEIGLQHSHDELLGSSQIIKEVLGRAEQVARTDTTVLILGETGTGKELLAQTIHRLSQRHQRPMIVVNCAALPAHLVESELFGHEKGAFTGAQAKRLGRFELAAGSTLFLDEIGELSLELQVKLLRVLQEKRFERLGGQQTIDCDVRIIAATNRDLLTAVQAGTFRMDLYYRLNVFPIVLPPLRQRREDLPELIWFFVRTIGEKNGKRIESIPRGAMRQLLDYSWPGNVRELRNVIERALILTSGPTLRVELPEGYQPASGRERTLADIQKRHIMAILKSTGWRIRGANGAAEILGLKPTTLEARMLKLGIKRAPDAARSSK